MSTELYGPWPRRLAQGPVRLLTADEVRALVVHEDSDLLALAKPGDVVCHPSKAGPWSSLAGAVRETFALEAAHLVFRLDRETSGVVLFAKHTRAASRLQRAMQERRIGKTYAALLTGELATAVTVDQPLGPDTASVVWVKSRVIPRDELARDGRSTAALAPGATADPRGAVQDAVTHFEPLVWSPARDFTVVRVRLETGRKHQIRAHAQWLGCPVVGDKIYGPDAQLFVDFVADGWTPALAKRLLLPRQALHCAAIDLTAAGWPLVLRAPWPEDLREFARTRLGLSEMPAV